MKLRYLFHVCMLLTSVEEAVPTNVKRKISNSIENQNDSSSIPNRPDVSSTEDDDWADLL